MQQVSDGNADCLVGGRVVNVRWMPREEGRRSGRRLFIVCRPLSLSAHLLLLCSLCQLRDLGAQALDIVLVRHLEQLNLTLHEFVMPPLVLVDIGEGLGLRR